MPRDPLNGSLPEAGRSQNVVGFSSYDAVRIAAAALLIIAAALKTFQLATEPVQGTHLFNSRWFLIAVVEFEVFFGLWLLAGLQPTISWTASIAYFSFLTILSVYNAISGQPNCGCFGNVSVHPSYTAGLDLAIVLCLAFCRPLELRRLADVCVFFRDVKLHGLPPRTMKKLVGIWLLVGTPAAFAMSVYNDTILSDTGDIIGNNQIVILEPESWVGKRFPLLDHIDNGKHLRKDKWLVLLFHHDCPKCQNAIKMYKEFAVLWTKDHNLPRVAFIDIPPYGANDGLMQFQGSIVLARLRDDKEWFVETPCVLEVSESIVMNVHLPETLELSSSP